MNDAVGIVVPAYEPDPERLVAYVEALATEVDSAEIRVELDDPQTEVVDRLSGTAASVGIWPVRRGKGAAITAGFDALDTARLAFADADGSTPPASVAELLSALDRCDLAVGSRRHPDARVTDHQTVLRRYLGDAFAWMARRMLPIGLYDYQCGAKALTRDTWEDVRPHVSEPGFAWDLELIGFVASLDRTVEEVPVAWTDAPGSTVQPLATAASLARALVSIRYRLAQLDGDMADRQETLVASDTDRKTSHADSG